jgi:hypothetical protein
VLHRRAFELRVLVHAEGTRKTSREPRAPFLEPQSHRTVDITLHTFSSPNRHGEPESQLLCSPSAVLLETGIVQAKTLLVDG